MNEKQLQRVKSMNVPEGAEEAAMALLTINLLAKLVTVQQFEDAVTATESQVR